MGKGLYLMLLSVIICTRNRPQSLEQTLQSIAESARECDKNSFEVLVVNNGDSLETKDIENNFIICLIKYKILIKMGAYLAICGSDKDAS